MTVLATCVVNGKDCKPSFLMIVLMHTMCFAHQLQLALVAASIEVIPIHEFFLNLNFIITIVGSSCKCNDELRAA